VIGNSTANLKNQQKANNFGDSLKKHDCWICSEIPANRNVNGNQLIFPICTKKSLFEHFVSNGTQINSKPAPLPLHSQFAVHTVVFIPTPPQIGAKKANFHIFQ
jgi:hypothetical protein